MMTFFKKDKLFEAINNLSQADKVKLHNLFYGKDPESKIWKMDELNEYFKDCQPSDIVDCIQMAGGNFETDDPYFYDDDYSGLVSIQGRQVDRFECSPFVSQYEYIDCIENLDEPTGILELDKILSMPDMNPAELEDELYCKIDSACERIIKAISKKYNLDITAAERNGFNNMLDLEHELAETLYKIIFADNFEM